MRGVEPTGNKKGANAEDGRMQQRLAAAQVGEIT